MYAMTPKERLLNRLDCKEVDRIPNLSIVKLFAAKYCGYKYGDFCSDYRVLVDAMTRTAKDFHLDVLSTMSDPFRETYDFGAQITIPEDNLPVLHEKFLKSVEEYEKKIKLFDPYHSTRMLDRMKAIELFKKRMVQNFRFLAG